MAGMGLIPQNDRPDCDTYAMDAETVWIDVGGTVSILIRQGQDGVDVDLYRAGQETWGSRETVSLGYTDDNTDHDDFPMSLEYDGLYGGDDFHTEQSAQEESDVASFYFGGE